MLATLTLSMLLDRKWIICYKVEYTLDAKLITKVPSLFDGRMYSSRIV